MEHFLDDNYGVVSRAQLLAIGCTQRDIEHLLRQGRLNRLRPGWYAGCLAHPHVIRAVRAGGALSCLSALRLAGLWVPADRQLHLRRTRYLDRRRLPDGMVVCGTAPVRRSVDTVAAALACAIHSHDAETALVVLESALHNRRMAHADIQDLAPSAKLAELMAKLDRAESGTETLTRLRLRARNISVRPQVEIAGVGRVDFIVGDRLVIEVDGYSYHSDPVAFAKDRERDRRLVALGYLVIRLTYNDVMTRWAQAEADILAVIRRGAHRWPSRRS